jgi:hypothetical protein
LNFSGWVYFPYFFYWQFPNRFSYDESASSMNMAYSMQHRHSLLHAEIPKKRTMNRILVLCCYFVWYLIFSIWCYCPFSSIHFHYFC